jgi:hypothetical protein
VLLGVLDSDCGLVIVPEFRSTITPPSGAIVFVAAFRLNGCVLCVVGCLHRVRTCIRVPCVCRDPQVTVIVLWMRSKRVFVLVFACVLFSQLQAHFVRVCCVFQVPI